MQCENHYIYDHKKCRTDVIFCNKAFKTNNDVVQRCTITTFELINHIIENEANQKLQSQGWLRYDRYTLDSFGV